VFSGLKNHLFRGKIDIVRRWGFLQDKRGSLQLLAPSSDCLDWKAHFGLFDKILTANSYALSPAILTLKMAVKKSILNPLPYSLLKLPAPVKPHNCRGSGQAMGRGENRFRHLESGFSGDIIQIKR
jgi:hypothetical protein